MWPKNISEHLNGQYLSGNIHATCNETKEIHTLKDDKRPTTLTIE